MVQKTMNIVWIFFILWNTIGSSPYVTAGENTGQTPDKIHSQKVFQHSTRVEKAMLTFKGASGSQRVEAMTILWENIEKGMPSQVVEKLLGPPDELIQKNIWRYELRSSQWLEILFDEQKLVEQTFLLLQSSEQANTERMHQEKEIYPGMSVTQLTEIFGEPHRQERASTFDIWFYHVDDEGLWQLLIRHNELIHVHYATVPSNVRPIPKNSSENTRNHQQRVSDIEMAISQFKNPVGYLEARSKAVRELSPLIHEGMTTDEVEALLGSPDGIVDLQKWGQEGYRWGYVIFYSEYLGIQFDPEGRVVEVFP